MSTYPFRPRCIEHLSCRIPVVIPLASVRTETLNSTQTAMRVMWAGDQLGTVRQDSPNSWIAFSGGSVVPTQVPPATSEDAIRALLAYVVNSAFHFRMALHG